MEEKVFATVRDRNGKPMVVSVSDSVRAGDVIRFTKENIPCLGLVHHVIAAAPEVAEVLEFLQEDIPDAEQVWHYTKN